MAGGVIGKLFGWLTGEKGTGEQQTSVEQETVSRAQERLNEVAGTNAEKPESQPDSDIQEKSIMETMTDHASGTATEAVEAVTEQAQEAVENIKQSVTQGIETAAETLSAETVHIERQPEENIENQDIVRLEENNMSGLSMVVNGVEVSGDVEDRTLLSGFLRDHLRLTGTHIGCDTSQCGACVVHVDGKAVKSCTMLAVQADGCEVTTIEGLAEGGELHPVQTAFKAHHGLQCGFCTPGMIMSAVDMIERYKASGKTLDEASIRAELEGNICRCTGYHNIVKAISAAADASA